MKNSRYILGTILTITIIHTTKITCFIKKLDAENFSISFNPTADQKKIEEEYMAFASIVNKRILIPGHEQKGFVVQGITHLPNNVSNPRGARCPLQICFTFILSKSVWC